MRKLLVVSQKGGVGKTTTSINLAAAAAAAGGRVLLLDADPLSNVSSALNLAQHGNRRSLRAAGFQVPGVLVTEVAPGLDVLSPYEDGSCPDADFDTLLRMLATPEVREGYDCLIVDAPPFLGARPVQMLKTADEFVLVMRAEANAYRTLPAFQELVQRSKGNAKPVQMRGILLTLGEGDAPGQGRWERELRGRFGTRVLPQVIPHDEEAVRSRDAGQVLVQATPEAAAALQFREVVETLGLVLARGRTGKRTESSPVLVAAATIQGGETAGTAGYAVALEEPTIPAFADKPTIPLPRKSAAPKPPALDEPDLPTDAGILRSMPEIPVLRLRRPGSTDTPGPATPPGGRRSGSEAPKAGEPRNPISPSKSLAAAGKSVPTGPINSNPPLMVWVGAAMVLGFGLRFFTIPTDMVPLAIGLAVTAGTLLILRLLMTTAEPPRKPASRSSLGSKRRSKEMNKVAPSRQEPKKELNARLASVTRRPKRPS